MHVRRLEEIGRDLAEVEAAIGAAMRPFAAQQALLVTIPGVVQRGVAGPKIHMGGPGPAC